MYLYNKLILILICNYLSAISRMLPEKFNFKIALVAARVAAYHEGINAIYLLC